MGKGSRNRSLREAEPKQEKKIKKPRRYRKPLPGAAKGAIASLVCILIVAAIVFGSLASNGTFKRNNILVRSKDGSHNINQQMATYMVWDALYYTASYQWAYLSDSIKTQTGITSQSQYCLYYAMSGVQDTLRTSMDSYANTLKEYVAVCDLADSFGLSLTDEEKKTARTEAESNLNYMAAINGFNVTAFIKMYIGNNVKLKDILDVAEMQTLYGKIVEKKQDEVKATITEEILIKYRDENPESFYSTDYISATTESEELKNALLAATSLNGFKTVLVKDAFDNGDNSYKLLFNKYMTTHSADANTILSAIEKKTSLDDLNAALTEKGMETPKEYLKSDETLNSTLSSWMFDSARKAFDAVTVSTADALYVVVLATAPADGKVTASVKTIELDAGESYGDDTAFKTNIFNTLLNELELLDSTDGMTLYTETEDEKIKDLLSDLKKAAEKVIPETKNERYTKEPKEGSYQEWMFKDVTESFGSPVAVNAVKDFSETKDEKTTYSIYMIEDPMKLNTDPLVNGGYLLFEGEGHEEKAQAFLDSIKDLTGDELSEKFSAESSSAVVSESISKTSIDFGALSDWLFDSSRAANDKKLIAIEDTKPSDSDKNDKGSCVAFYQDTKLTWKSNAESGYTTKTMQDWVEGLISSYELTGIKKIKDKNPASTSATTTAATTTSASDNEPVTA